MQSDLEVRKIQNRSRRHRMKTERARISKTPGDGLPTDRVAIEVVGLTWTYGNGEYVFKELNLKAEQGSIVAVVGEHGSGKTTLMRLLGNSLLPQEGIVFVPSHLRALWVPEELVLLNTTAWANLTFGFQAAHPNRVIKILKGFGMNKLVGIVKDDLKELGRAHEIDQDIEKLGQNYLPGFASSDEAPNEAHKSNLWGNLLSGSEKSKISLARALIMNPEVLVVQRPTSSFDSEARQVIMKCLMSHVRNRGYFLPTGGVKNRRPRTLFFSSSTQDEVGHADIVWHLPKHIG